MPRKRREKVKEIFGELTKKDESKEHVAGCQMTSILISIIFKLLILKKFYNYIFIN